MANPASSGRIKNITDNVATTEAVRGWAQGGGTYSDDAAAELARRGEPLEGPAIADPVPAWLERFPTEMIRTFGREIGREGYELGLGSLRLFFAAHGVTATEDELSAFRVEAITRAMREACDAGAKPYFHALVRREGE